MRAARLIPAALLLGLAVAACAGPAQPGWTFAPPPTPAPSAAPSAEPGGGAPAVAPSAAPSAPAGGTGGTGGTVLNLAASGVQWVETALEAPAGQPFQIVFDNQDPSIPHNVDILDGSGAHVFPGADITGPSAITYDVPALGAGTYKYICKWHPNMVGELTVK